MISFAVVVLSSLLACQTNAAISSCSTDVVNYIKLFWSGYGVPVNTLQKIQNTGQYRLVYATDEVIKDVAVNEAQCVAMDTTDCTITYTIQQDCYASNNIYYTNDVTEDDEGVITTTCGCYIIYNILVGNGVCAQYFARTEEGYSGCLQGAIFVDKDRWNDSCTQTTINMAHGIMTLMGIEFDYSWGESCFDDNICTCSD